MKLLLDTNIWIWSVLDPSKLGQRIIALLRNGTSELWHLPVLLWELAILAEKGKIQLRGGLWNSIDIAQRSAPMREAPLTSEVVRA